MAFMQNRCEGRRLRQLQAYPQSYNNKRCTEQEGQPPAPGFERFGRHRMADGKHYNEAEQKADRRGNLDEAGIEAATAFGGVFRHVGRCAAVFTAKRQTLQHAQDDERHRSDPADAVVGRQKADQEGRKTHDQDGDEEGVLAAQLVADIAEQDRAERTEAEAYGETSPDEQRFQSGIA